jgi:hypothetical protein
MEEYDSVYVKSVKKKLISQTIDKKKPDRKGMLVALKNTRTTEEIISSLLGVLY